VMEHELVECLLKMDEPTTIADYYSIMKARLSIISSDRARVTRCGVCAAHSRDGDRDE